jgi:hypothetical protein
MRMEQEAAFLKQRVGQRASPSGRIGERTQEVVESVRRLQQDCVREVADQARTALKPLEG